MFKQLNLKKELLENLDELKFLSMTPIQAECLPLILDGKDVIAQAKTGSGKTAAFTLGILNSVVTEGSRVRGLILCPTRELADQVAKEVRRLARMLKNIKVLTLCGGTAEYHQEKSLSHGAHIVVGTPGRVLRLLKKETLKLDLVETFVLDEADRMLDMGFHEDIMEIANFLPKEKRQTMLFSATFPEEIKELGASIQTDAVIVKIDIEHKANSIDQKFYELESHKDKSDVLIKILNQYRPERLIIFCKTKIITDQVADYLSNQGIYAESIHGDLDQSDRTTVLTMFSNRSLSVLVATDVAARGLDIQDLEAVINYDIPSDPEIYIHRVGRTGRAGKKGLAFSLFTEQEDYKVKAIEELANIKFEVEDLASFEDSKKYDLVPPMETMYIAGGKKNKLRPGDIVGALIGEANLAATDIGDITIGAITTYVAVKRDCIENAIKKLKDGRIKNKKFNVGLA
jgi:ATP-dependent RNA helicase DbpA